MGCSASKQGLGQYKRRSENANSWYSPLPRSVSAPIHNRPSKLPAHAHHDIHEDPAHTGSFVRLLHKKKTLSPPPERPTSIVKQPSDYHDNHSHHQHHHHHHDSAGCIELNPSVKKYTHASNHALNLKDHIQGDDFSGTSLQQLQLAKVSGAHNVKKGNAQGILTSQGTSDEQSAPGLPFDAPSFRFLEHFSQASKEYLNCGSVVHNVDDTSGDGDDEGMDIIKDGSCNITNGLRERRKSRFAPRASNKIHHIKSKSVEKALSFNTVLALDNEFSETGPTAWPKRATQLSKKRKQQSLDVADPDTSLSLDGLEEKLHRLCDGDNRTEHAHTTGFSEVESPKVESNVPGCKLSSAFKEVTPGGSQLSTPHRSPSMSPTLSPSLKGSSSPLFDPSILAAFEEAVESIRYTVPDDWTLVHNDTSNEPSSFSSSDKFTWISSEPSSDGESPQSLSQELFSSQMHDDPSYEIMLHDEVDAKRLKIDSSVFSIDLEGFELRCPPRGEDKVVLYFTSLRGVRKTYQDCCALRFILQGLGVDVDERDVWMHLKFREELADLLGAQGLPVPRLFIKGRYIGGVEEVKQLHEDGLLVRLIEDLPTFGKFRKSCDGCADVRFIPCLTCSGSCKLLDYELDEMVKCFECNENGLILCPICRSS